MTGDDLRRFQTLDIDSSAISLEQGSLTPYFCTPVNAQLVGSIGCDGVHFILLPEDERVFCVEPSLGELGTYVLPVAKDFRAFLSYVLYCRDASPLSQIFYLSADRFQQLLDEDARAEWPGSEVFFAKKNAALEVISEVFELVPADPYAEVKSLQAAFDPSMLCFSDEYYDVLGIERG